jgi:hypothetical protein
MKRPALALATAALALATLPLAGCPEREEAINKVGGAPKEQVDIARERLNRAENKLQDNAAAAAAATE